MIYPCSYEELRDIIFSAVYNPIPKTIVIVLRQEHIAKELEKIIYDLIEIKPKQYEKSYYYSVFTGVNGGRIQIYAIKNRLCTLGLRANDVIADVEFPLNDFYQLFQPMCNIGVGALYSIDTYNFYSSFADPHKKGMEEIEYWKKVRKEDENKDVN